MDFKELSRAFKVSESSASGLCWNIEFISNLGEIIHIGDRAGQLNRQGYWTVWFNGRRYLVHRIILLITNGKLSEGMVVDHINRIRSDNRYCNLREITQGENAKNRGSWGESKRNNLIIRTNMDELGDI